MAQADGLDEPLHLIEGWTGLEVGPEGPRIISYQTRSPVMELIVQRLPQTLWVVGTSYIVGILIALPLGIISAYKQYSVFDQVGTFISMVGFSVPTFFTGVLFIVIFAVNLGWFPSVYDTTHRVTDWDSFVVQLKQIIMPVMVLGLFNASQISPLPARSRCSTTSTRITSAPRRAKGPERKGGGAGPCAEELDDPGRHRHRAERARRLRRCDHHRTGVQGERHRPASDHRDPGRRRAGGAGPSPSSSPC